MNIATLTIEMAANVARLQQDLQAARGSVDSTFASIGSSVAKLKALVGTVFAGIAVGELLGAVDKVKTAAVDIERIAAASGASLDEFQRAAAGAKTLGVNVEKFGDIMKDTQDKLGDFLMTGGGELKDFFDTIGPKVGVTAESFRNLSGPQALQLFYSSLEKANVGQKVMIQQMESIANDASMLAPLLANGGAEFKSLGEEAAKAGALMSSELIYASKNLGSEMSRLDTMVGGITNSIMEGLIPVMAEMAAASREELSAGFEAVSAWVQDNKEHLLGAWELTKAIGAEVWSIVEVAIELAVGIGKWAVESGFLEASLITIGLLVAGFKDGVDIVGAAFAKLGSIILNAVAKPMSGFLNDVGVVLKWAGQGDLAGVFLDAAEGIKTAGEAGAQYAAGVADKFAAGDTAVARFTAGLGASTQAAQAAAKSTYTAYQALGTGAGISAKAAEEAKKSADKAAAAAQKLAEEGVKLAASLLAQDSGLSGDFAAKWDKLNAAYKAGAVSLADLTQAQKLLLAEQPAMKAAADAQKKALEEEAQAWSDVRSAMLAYRHAQEQAAQSVADGNQALRDEIELIGLSSKERARVLQQRTQAIILTKQATLAEMERQAAITGTMTREQIALAAEIEGLQERNELLGAQEARESWTGFWESVNSTAHDTFVDVANNGMSAFKRIGQTLKSAVLDMLYQLTIKKWIVSIGASAGGGVGGMAQAASATASTLGAAGDAGSLLSAGSALSSLGAFGGAVSGFGTAALSAAQTMVGMTGTVAQMTTSLAAAGHTAASGLAAGVQAFQMIPGWGWALAGIALLAGSGLGKTRGANHGGGIYSSAGLSDQDAAQSIAGGLGWADPVTDFTTRGNAALSGQVKTAVDSLLEMYAGLGALAKGAVTDLEVVAGFAANSKHKDEDVYGYFKIFDKMTGDLLSAYSNREMGKDGDAAWAQYVADLGSAMVSQLLSADIPSWMATVLNDLGEAPTMDELTAAVAKIHTIDAAFGTFSATIDGFAGLTDKAREALMLAAGGIEGLSSSLGSYYAEYYSDAERLAHSTKTVGDVFAEMGVAVPTTRAGLRALIEAQLALGESGAAEAAKLLKVAPAFAEASKGAEEAAAALLDSVGISGGEIAKTLRDSMLGRIDASEAGAQIATMVTDGIYNAVAGGFASEITDLMTTSIISPVIQAAITGASITEAVSQSAIDNMLTQAQAAAAALGQVLNNPAFKDAIAQIGVAVTGAFGGGKAGGGAAGGGSGSNLFAIGGSAGGGYMPPEFQTFGTLASETIESNKKVSELLQKLLNPEKLFENRYKQLDSIATDKRDELVAVQVSRTQGYASTLNRLPGEIAADLQAIQGMKDRLESGGTVADGVIEAMQSQLSAKVTAMAQLENQLREWYLAQARLIAAEDMMALSDEAKTATAKTAELKRTGGLEDPLIKLKESFAQKITAIDEGINAALNAEIAARSADAGDAKALMDKYPLMRQWQMSDDEWADAKKLFGDSIGRNMYADEAQYMRDVIAQMEEGIADLTAEQQTYIDSLNDWYKAQAELLSTEMLVDINQQIKALQAQQEGPLTAIKTAIAKYVKDLTDLGTLDADAQTAIDQLSGLQLTAGRKALYDQLLSPEEMKARNTAQLSADFGLLGTTLPASTDALQSMIDAARAAGKITLADSLLELVPAFIALQGAAGGVGDVLGNLRTATDDAYAALERAVGVQRDLLNESITHLQAVFDMTRDAARALYGEVESASQQSAAAGRAFIDNALANAQTTGYMPDSDALREAIDGVRKGIAAQQGASTFEAERDRLVLAGKLTDLKDIAQPQLTEAQRQLAALEEMLKAERTQIDELRGINTSVLSVADAMTALAAAIAAEKAAASTQGPQPSWNPNDMVFIPGSGSGGGALNEDKDKLPGFAAGINVVPYDMTARIHKGEAVIPERFNPFNPGAQLGQAQQGSGTAELVAEIRALRAEVAALRAAGERTARSTADLLEITDQKSEGGNADRVEVMNVAELASAIAREMAPA